MDKPMSLAEKIRKKIHEDVGWEPVSEPGPPEHLFEITVGHPGNASLVAADDHLEALNLYLEKYGPDDVDAMIGRRLHLTVVRKNHEEPVHGIPAKQWLAEHPHHGVLYRPHSGSRWSRYVAECEERAKQTLVAMLGDYNKALGRDNE